MLARREDCLLFAGFNMTKFSSSKELKWNTNSTIIFFSHFFNVLLWWIFSKQRIGNFQGITILTKLSNREKLGRFLAAMTWFPVTCGELTPFGKATLSNVVGWFRLSTSDAEEEGDSPDHIKKSSWCQEKGRYYTSFLSCLTSD